MKIKYIESYDQDNNTLYEQYDVQLLKDEILQINRALKFYIVNNKKLTYETIERVVKMINEIEG